MKPFTGDLANYLASIRNQADAQLAFADCFTFTTYYGVTLCYTNADVPIDYNGSVFVANAILINGLKYKSQLGLEVDTQEITISAHPTDMDQTADVFSLGDLYSVPDVFSAVEGVAFLQALRTLFFDGARIQRDRVFFSDWIGGTIVGGVTLFKGRLADISEIGRTTARLNVASDLTYLDLNMPRNVWQQTCMHTLYDSGCTLHEADFSVKGAVGAGSTNLVINWAGSATKFQQGKIAFSGGLNNGYERTISTANPGQSLTLIYPLPVDPSEGDQFTVYNGCDHTMGTCQNVFNNLANYRGFPFVPPPQMAY